MKNIVQRIVVSVAALALAGSAGGSDAPAVPSLSKPRIVVDLARFGWTPPPSESNRSFFKDISIEKIESIDEHTKIVFLSQDLLVAYHTKQEGKEWRTARRELEAFFIRTSDGSLLATKRWPASVRRDSFDHWDSEARILPLSTGRFLVHAAGVLMLYGNNLELIREKKLEPSEPNDLWGAQSTGGGSLIFLRHGRPSSLEATYIWLNSETLEPTHLLTGSFWAGVATENSVITRSPSGIQEVDRGGHARTICDDPLCQKGGPSAALSSGAIAFSGETGIGIIERSRGVLWWEGVEHSSLANFFLFRAAASGKRLAVALESPRRFSFHGFEVKNSPVMLVYDAESGVPVRALRLKMRNNGEFDVALSPDATQVAVFDAHGLSIYSVEAPSSAAATCPDLREQSRLTVNLPQIASHHQNPDFTTENAEAQKPTCILLGSCHFD